MERCECPEGWKDRPYRQDCVSGQVARGDVTGVAVPVPWRQMPHCCCPCHQKERDDDCVS